MIRTLLLALLAFAVVPASHAAEPTPAPLVLAQASSVPAPSLAPNRVTPQEQVQVQRNSGYETAAIAAVAAGAGALVVVLGSSGLTAVLVVGGALGIYYLASGEAVDRR